MCNLCVCVCFQPPPACEEKQQESAMDELKGILVTDSTRPVFLLVNVFMSNKPGGELVTHLHHLSEGVEPKPADTGWGAGFTWTDSTQSEPGDRTRTLLCAYNRANHITSH